MQGARRMAARCSVRGTTRLELIVHAGGGVDMSCVHVRERRDMLALMLVGVDSVSQSSTFFVMSAIGRHGQRCVVSTLRAWSHAHGCRPSGRISQSWLRRAVVLVTSVNQRERPSRGACCRPSTACPRPRRRFLPVSQACIRGTAEGIPGTPLHAGLLPPSPL